MAGGAGAATYGSHRRDRTAEWAGLGAMVAGMALSASSQADLRYWEMLPRTVYIIPASLPPGPHTLIVAAGPSQSRPLTLTIPPAPPGNAGGDNVVLYFRLALMAIRGRTAIRRNIPREKKSGAFEGKGRRRTTRTIGPG